MRTDLPKGWRVEYAYRTSDCITEVWAIGPDGERRLLGDYSDLLQITAEGITIDWELVARSIE